MSKQMFTPEEHATRLPGWRKWAQEHGVRVPPAFLYNYVPTSAIDHVGNAVAAERERCARIAKAARCYSSGDPRDDANNSACDQIARQIRSGE